MADEPHFAPGTILLTGQPDVWTSLCEVAELTEGRGKFVEIGGFELAVFLDQGNVFAIDNRCPHAGGNLAGGLVNDGCAVCPWHNWAFHLESGQLRGAELVTVRNYKIRKISRPGKPDLIQADLPMY